MFEEVNDVGKEIIESIWVINRTENYDSQKQEFKAKLVAWGFKR